jgi:alkanesulfonate monooxygenase SsuD/methylene tetrahydromethanopterin reductase-like flavin-dependent oxidoreductase (luciferase family)
MALAIIGGMPERFTTFVNLYREGARRAGTDPATLRLGINSHGLIADTSHEASDAFFPGYAEVMSRIGAERGWPPASRTGSSATTAS